MKRHDPMIGLLMILIGIMLLIFAAFAHGQTTVNVSGTLQTYGGTALTNAYIEASLVNCGKNTPTINGVAQLFTAPVDFYADASGNITAAANNGVQPALWPNDVISCAGQFTSRYAVTLYANGVSVGPTKYYMLATGTPFNINTATPIQTVPPLVPYPNPQVCPAGQIIYGLNRDLSPACENLPNGASNAVVTNPAGTQIILQPGGTQLTVQGILQATHLNSTAIDASPIGQTTMAPAAFSSLIVDSGFNGFPITTQSTLPALRRGITLAADPAGDITLWFNSNESPAGFFVKDGATSTQYLGVTTGGIAGNLTGNVTGNLTGNVSGNINGTTGTFSGAVSGGSFSGPLTGNVNGNVTGNLTGNVTGNVSGTAGSLAGSPTQCSGGTGTFGYSTGINANGNANCATAKKYSGGHIGAASCVTGSASFSTCPSTVTLDSSMDDTNYSVSCVGETPSDPRAGINGAIPVTATTVSVIVVTNGSAAVSYGDISCTAIHH